MTTSSEMNAILDRLLHNTPTDGDMETLRQWLQSAEGQQFAQQITQSTPPPPTPSKYNINIGKITGAVVGADGRSHLLRHRCGNPEKLG